MLKKILYAFICALLVFAVACRKDSTFTDTEIEPPRPVITVEATLLGLVTDLDGNTIEGALLTIGNSQTTSDENGYFKLTGFTDSENAIVKVEMPGYFDSWHAFRYFEEDISQTKIRLTPRTNPLTLPANDGGEIEFENTTINFQAGSFVDESGNDYHGMVSIYTAYLDPTNPELHTFMPGNLTAFDANDQLRLLVTYGMINVELEGEAGQKLQITQPATIEMTVPGSILNRAPATIPLWYFDTEKQRWVEEGMATLQGDQYIGTVDHFSFWNCDDPYRLINLTGRAYFGESGASLEVCITILSNGDQSCTTTSPNSGYFGGPVPGGEELLLEIYSECGDVVWSETIGPFNDDVTVGPYQLSLPQTWALVHGNVIDCDGNLVTDGYVFGVWNNSQSGVFYLDANGAFSKYINTCGAPEITLRAVDATELKSGDLTTFALVPDTDAGTLEACDNDFVDGIYLDYGTESYVVPGATVAITSVSNMNGPGTQYHFFATDDQGNGNVVTYTVTIIDWQNNADTHIIGPGDWQGPSPFFFVCEAGDINFISIGSAPGEFVEIEVSNVDVVTVDGAPSTQTTYAGGNFRIVGIIQ